MFKTFVLLLLLVPTLCFGQQIIKTTPYTRGLLEQVSASAARSYLGVSGGVGGSVAGATTQIQFNSNDVFSASSRLTFTNSTAVFQVSQGGNQFVQVGSDYAHGGTNFGSSVWINGEDDQQKAVYLGAAAAMYNPPFTSDIRFNIVGQGDILNISAASGRTGIGIGNSSPTSLLDAMGSYGVGVISATASTTLGDDSSTVIANGDAESSSFTVTLPDPVENIRRIYTIKNTSHTYAVTVDSIGGENIDGSATYSLPSFGKYVQVQAFDGQWWIIGQN